MGNNLYNFIFTGEEKAVEEVGEGVVGGIAPELVDVGSEEFFGTCHDEAVGRVGSLAAGACRADEVEVPSVADDIGSFGESSCNALWFGSFGEAHAVVGELDAVDAMEGAPEKIFLSFVFDGEGVYRVFYAYLTADEEFLGVAIGAIGLCGVGDTYAALPSASPCRHGHIEVVGVAEPLHVGCPNGGILDERRPGVVVEGRADITPVDEVLRTVDWHVVDDFCG